MLSKRLSKFAPLCAGAVAAGLGASSALAALTVDLRITAVTGSAGSVISADRKSVTPGPTGNVTVTMGVWAQVTGNDPSKFQTVQLVSGSFLSSLGGMLGNLTVTNIPGTAGSVFTANSFSTGLSQDLDGDSDNDVGNNNNFNADNFFRARGGNMFGPNSFATTEGMPGGPTTDNGLAVGFTHNAITGGTEYRIALLRFVQTSGAGLGTAVNFRPWAVAEGAVWGEDMNEIPHYDSDADQTTYTYEISSSDSGKNPALGIFQAGGAVLIGPQGGGTTPEPTTLGLIGIAGLGLLARRRKA